ARAEDEEDDDEDEQQLAEAEIHRATPPLRRKLARMLPASFSRAGRPLVWAHRGASADAPENTVAAFELARAQGADGVELDAQRCASGEVVVLHDESLGRTTGFAGLVTEPPSATVRALAAGGRTAEPFRGERGPLHAG